MLGSPEQQASAFVTEEEGTMLLPRKRAPAMRAVPWPPASSFLPNGRDVLGCPPAYLVNGWEAAGLALVYLTTSTWSTPFGHLPAGDGAIGK